MPELSPPPKTLSDSFRGYSRRSWRFWICCSSRLRIFICLSRVCPVTIETIHCPEQFTRGAYICDRHAVIEYFAHYSISVVGGGVASVRLTQIARLHVISVSRIEMKALEIWDMCPEGLRTISGKSEDKGKVCQVKVISASLRSARAIILRLNTQWMETRKKYREYS